THSVLHCFPTRRSSDLGAATAAVAVAVASVMATLVAVIRQCRKFQRPLPIASICHACGLSTTVSTRERNAVGCRPWSAGLSWLRSEEHTSELQSRSDLV